VESFAFYFKNVILAFRWNLLFLLPTFSSSYSSFYNPAPLFRLSYSAARAFSLSSVFNLIYISSLSFYLSFPLLHAGNIYYFRSVSLIRILKRGELVMKNRGPFYRDIDDRKCFVRLFHLVHLEKPLFFLSLSLLRSLFFHAPRLTLNHMRGDKSYAFLGQLIRHKISAKYGRTSIKLLPHTFICKSRNWLAIYILLCVWISLYNNLYQYLRFTNYARYRQIINR